MSTIVTRAGKGSALTWTEGDANFTNLNNDKLQNIVEDTTPQLGGNLDVQANIITTSTTNGAIELAPNGTGDVLLSADTVRVGDSNANATITTNGTGDLILSTNGGTNSGVITIQDGLDNDITVVPSGTGKVHFETSETRVGINNTNAKITTKGTGDLTLDTHSGTNSGSITIADGVNGNITLAPNGTGKVVISGDLQIDGTTTTVNSTTLDVDDINITIAKGAANAAAANGGGITLEGPTTAATITYASATDSWNFNKYVNMTGGIQVTSDAVIGGDAFKVRSVSGAQYVEISAGDNQINFSGAGVLSGQTNFTLVSGNASVLVDGTTNGHVTITTDGTGDIRLDADTVRIGDSGSEAVLTTNGSGGLRISTNNNSTTGYIAINSGANGNITLEPNGTGDVFVVADTLRIGDQNTTANITTFGTGNLTLSTNNGTNTGSITIAQGVNGQMTLACNGTGVIASLSPQIIIGSFGDNNSAVTGRHQATASASDQRHSITAQKQRTDILIAAMTDEPAVYSFSVRDSAAVNRTFGRWIGRYAGPSTNPSFELRGSPDGFTTTVSYATIGSGTTVWGNTNTAYTLTTNGTGNLTINTNSGTNSGSIVITQGSNADITVTPNGTGKTVVTNIVPIEYVYTAGSTTGTITPDAALGTIQSITLTGNITFNAFSTPIAGETITMIITQPASGGPYTLTSTMKFAGASKTLSTAANAVDILSVTYDGTNYWASLSKGYA